MKHLFPEKSPEIIRAISCGQTFEGEDTRWKLSLPSSVYQIEVSYSPFYQLISTNIGCSGSVQVEVRTFWFKVIDVCEAHKIKLIRNCAQDKNQLEGGKIMGNLWSLENNVITFFKRMHGFLRDPT